MLFRCALSVCNLSLCCLKNERFLIWKQNELEASNAGKEENLPAARGRQQSSNKPHGVPRPVRSESPAVVDRRSARVSRSILLGTLQFQGTLSFVFQSHSADNVLSSNGGPGQKRAPSAANVAHMTDQEVIRRSIDRGLLDMDTNAIHRLQSEIVSN